MKVGILTNLHPYCGNAEYARDIQQHLGKLCDVKLSDNVNELLPADVVFINHHPARVKMSIELLDKIKWAGAKSIVIFQESFDTEFASDMILKLADAVMAHEPMIGDIPVDYIPVGIPVVDNLPEPKEPMIGVAGFAFPWKRFDVTAEIAKTFGVKCRIVSAQANINDTSLYLAGIRGHLGSLADMYLNWYSTEDIARLLAECTLNIFWYQSQTHADQIGQTGSARLGVAARRPMIISRHRKFRTLLPYEDEFYIADTEQQAVDFAKEILDNPEKAKRPNRVIKEMGWDKTSKQFLDLIERVTKQ